MKSAAFRLGSYVLLAMLTFIGVAVVVTGQPFIKRTDNGTLMSQHSSTTTTTPAAYPVPNTAASASSSDIHRNGEAGSSQSVPTNTPSVREPRPTQRVLTAAELAAYPPPRFTETPLLPAPTPTIDPDPPVIVRVTGHGMADIPSATRSSPVIAIGTVKHVLPARWTTADGKRPPSVARGEGTNGNAIFRPVLIDVDEYLRGDQREPILYIYAWGGHMGRDVYDDGPNTRTSFTEGERVVVFLKKMSEDYPALNGKPHWVVNEQYKITADNQAASVYHTIPLEQLRAEIQTALQP